MDFRQALLIPVGCAVFEHLGVTASLWVNGDWIEINGGRSVVNVEVEQGLYLNRVDYNRRCLDEARRTQATVVGHFAGCSDLFVPIVVDGKTRAFIVTGPFLSAPIAAEHALSRWNEMTGRPGLITDVEFGRYLDQLLATLVLDTKQAAEFQKTIESLAGWIAGKSSAGSVRSQAQRFTNNATGPRRAEYVWSVVDAMLDEQRSRPWKNDTFHLNELRLPRMPERVAVGLFASRNAERDPVRERVARIALQRAAVSLAVEEGGTISGKLAEQGITLLAVPRRGSRDALLAFTRRLSEVASRNHELDVHWGVSQLSAPLHDQYHVALTAAESALARGVPVEFEKATGDRASRFPALSLELQRLAAAEPEALPLAFEHFLQAVAERSHRRVEAASAYLDSAFELVSHAIALRGDLDESSLPALRERLGRQVAEARSLEQVGSAYRGAIRNIVDGLQRPTEARRDRNLRRALAFVQRRYAEPISVDEVARVAGFASTYFSRLFHELQGVTFVSYLRKLRVERAKELLRDTSLDLERIAELSGFSTRNYLTRVFKDVTGMTPASHRRKVHARLVKEGLASVGGSRPKSRKRIHQS